MNTFVNRLISICQSDKAHKCNVSSYCRRWEHNDPNEHGGSWRRLYCERHLAEYLETLEASYFESQKEECEKLIALVKNHIYVIRLRSLAPTK